MKKLFLNYFTIVNCLVVFSITSCDEDSVSPKCTPLPENEITAFDLRTDINCDYGTFGCNNCVTDVPATFGQRASGSSNNRHRFYFRPNDSPLNGTQEPDLFAGAFADHVQGVARIPGLRNDNYFAYSRNARDVGDAAVYIAEFDKIESDGDALKWASVRTSDETEKYSYYRFSDANHAGGMQALGGMLFVANDCDEGNTCDAFIQIMDVRSPNNAFYLNRFDINGEALSSGISSRAAAVAAIQLSDGRHLTFIRGRESDRSGWFYISNTPQICFATEWTLVDVWNADDLPEQTPWESWESLNFLSDCRNGDIYMIAYGTLDNKSFLYKLTRNLNTITGKYDYNFQYIDGRGLNTTGISLTGGVSTRYGAGAHITPNGDIVSYVTDRTEIDMNEFRYNQ